MIKITPSTPQISRTPRLCLNCEHAIITPNVNIHKPSVKCALFYKMDLVYVEKKYESAIEVRQDEEKCGISGKLYSGRTTSDRLV